MVQEKRVVTVTINPAIDQTISIPNFTAGAVNRVQSSRMDAGGKGINVASFLADFGHPAIVTGFLGEDNDEIFRRLFQRKNIEDRCVRIAGQTRIGVKISDQALNQTTDINFPGETPSDADIGRLFAILAELAASHEWFVLSGSIPRGVSADIYAEMMRALRGKKVALDASGDGFVRAISAGPWLIKPNVDELRAFTGQPLESQAAILDAAHSLKERYGIAVVVISMGQQGAIFVEGDQALWAIPPEVAVKSTVGAGDAMVAGTIAAKLRGLSLVDCARLATAFSATAISHLGHDLPSIAEVEALQQQVTIRDLAQA